MAESSESTSSPDREGDAGTPNRQGASKLWAWLDDRMGLSAIRYKVPGHANTFWYTLGGITFVGIIVLVVTGIWIGQFYDPTPSGARESVLFIQNEATLGDVIRGIHIWTSYIVVVTALLHLIRIFVTASYKIPREINWLVGVALLGLLVFGGIFTGTVLRWDQEAYEALVHNLELANLLGVFGAFFSEGFTTSVPIVTRLYIAHISIVPLLLALFIIAHVFLIKYHGISPKPSQADAGEAPGGKLPEDKQTGRYPTHVRLMLGYGLAFLALAGALAVIWPQPIGPAPDPTIEVTKPPWVFYWLYALENWLGLNGIVYGTIGIFVLLALVPFIDRSSVRSPRRRIVSLSIGAVVLIAVVALSIYVAFTPVVQHLD